MELDEYRQQDALALAGLIKSGKISPQELIDAAIQAIEAVNPQINAVIHTMYDQARSKAAGELPEGTFKGVPFLLKDLLSTHAGEPMRHGSRFLRDYVPDYDTEVVKRYRAAGLIILGKTNVPELGLSPYTEPELFGPTTNPWDLERTAGGSSGGSAAAVASRMVPLANGNDGAGSLRVPAACTGIFTLMASRGRVPMGPVRTEVWHGLVRQGVMSRTVRDSAAMLDVIRGPDPGAPFFPPEPEQPYLNSVTQDPPRLRIAFTGQPILGKTMHKDMVDGLQDTARLLEQLGHEVVEASPRIDSRGTSVALFKLILTELRADIAAFERLLGKQAQFSEFETATWAVKLLGERVTGLELSEAMRQLERTTRAMGSFLENFDLWLTPTTSTPPFKTGALQLKGLQAWLLRTLGRLNAGGLIERFGGVESAAADLFDFMPTAPLANIAGLPSMSVPLYWNRQGLPVGLQFTGKYAEETGLFQLASQLERAQPWADRLPAVHA